MAPVRVAAGPAANLVLAALAGLLARAIYGQDMAGFQKAAFEMVEFFVAINAAVIVFNLIPLPVFDGGRILVSFLPAPVRDFADRNDHWFVLGTFVTLLGIAFLAPQVMVALFGEAVVGITNTLTGSVG